MGTIRSFYRIGLFFTVVMLAGCDLGKPKDPVPPRPTGTMSDLAAFTAMHQSAALEGTVGSRCYLQGERMMRVRGYGLVLGLAGKGGRNCAPSVREYLLKEIRRVRLANPQTEYKKTPEQLIDSPDAAVVEVVGEIPAGATKGQTFDVAVSASSFDPDTESIAGGYLLMSELKVYRQVSPQEIIEGRSLARAHGSIFMNPFIRGDKNSAGVNPREGRVLAGGVVLADRELSLVTVFESYATVRQIQDTINRQFPADPKTAEALTPTTVKLRIPPQYRGRERRFLELVMHLPLSGAAANREARCKQLMAEMIRPDAPLEDVALSLEGIGPTATGMVKSLYTHNRREVNYYAARTGLRLGDHLALEVVARHARDEKSPFRAVAIREIGDCGMAPRSGAILRELLNDSDPRIRILAYESLRRVDPDSVMTRIVGHEPENFVLDVVPSDGPLLVYARRMRTRRIALIGGGDHPTLRPPLLYTQDGKPIVLSASPNDKSISAIRKDQKGKIILGPFRLGLALPDFVHFLGNDPKADIYGQPQGLGLDYAVVLDVLYRFCEKGGIQAEFRWEEQGIEDLVGPTQPVGRPESEL